MCMCVHIIEVEVEDTSVGDTAVKKNKIILFIFSIIPACMSLARPVCVHTCMAAVRVYNYMY